MITTIEKDFAEYQSLAKFREKSLRVLALCNEVELTMETFYHFTLLLLLVLKTWQLTQTTNANDSEEAVGLLEIFTGQGLDILL